MKEILFLGFLIISAWQDVREKEVDSWLYIVFGGLIWFGKLCFEGPVSMGPEAANVIPGILMVLFSRWSGGAMGEGDGWFFVVAGVALGLKKSVALFLSSLLLCSFCCFLMLIWGRKKHVSMKKKTVPFLPFTVPAALWILGR